MFSEGQRSVANVASIASIVVLVVVVAVRVHVLRDRVDPVVVVAVRFDRQVSLRDTARRETSGGGRELSVY